ncbi:hypothetical protein [Anaerotignum lactatifermentans]|uniref:hypothetical protein n=1 Tax=Anaerotignum lactatifermentans TaxID=160404 RepID=UPI0024313679|nr:hypothetical protein [Anaerotignum lactatifermentans]
MMNKTHIALCICAGLLVVNTGFLFQISNRQKALEQQMANMQNQVMDSISVNTSSITQRMENILEKQSSLLSSSNFSVQKQDGAIVLLAEATPKAITDGETAEFRVKKADGSVQSQKATLENGVWKTTMETGLFDDGTLSIAISSNGATKQEELGSVSTAQYSNIDAQSQWGQNSSTLYLLVYPSDSFYEAKDIVKAEANVENANTGECFTVPMSLMDNPDDALEDVYANEPMAPTPEIGTLQRLGFSADFTNKFEEGIDYLITFSVTTTDGTVLSGGENSTSYRKEKAGGTTSLSGGSLTLQP